MQKFLDEMCVDSANPTLEEVKAMLSLTEKHCTNRGVPPPWQPSESKLGSESKDSIAYSMFPLQPKDQANWDFYCKQEATLWTAKELDFTKDRRDFVNLPKRYKELYYDLFGFFSPGDGLVGKNILRFLNECTTFSESIFFNVQLFIETVHSEAYGLSITSVVPDQEKQREVFGMIDELPCVIAKADFFKKYIESNLEKKYRYLAAAVTERVFFVSLFAIVFYFRNKGIMSNFVFLNEQVGKDETLHGDYYASKVKEIGFNTEEERKTALAIVQEGVDIEIEFVKYLLRSPIDSEQEDKIGGITVENLSKYVRQLADHLLVLCGLPIHYNETVKLPWMVGMSDDKKTNFYEGQVGAYKKFGQRGNDWQKAIEGSDSEDDGVANPDDIDF